MNIEEKLAAYSVDGPGGCRLWVGAHVPKGYGCVRYNGSTRRAHRVAYEIAKGPIPSGHQIDHLCRKPSCINPDHLEAVTASVNIQRFYDAVKSPFLCDNGHPWKDNTRFNATSGQRFCRTCMVAWKRAWRERRKALGGRSKDGYALRE